jgi:hypothetical protein
MLWFEILTAYAKGQEINHPARTFIVAIFKEEGFPVTETPTGVTPEWLYRLISKYDLLYSDKR